MKKLLHTLLVGFLFLGCSRPYDLIIRNGLVLDGTGKEGIQADVAVRGGKIVAVGTLPEDAKAKHVIDASGKVVAPGFIDIHTHAERKLLRFPNIENYITQGVTTVVGGNCGGSPLPIGAYFAKAESLRIAVNLALLVGHNTVRRRVMGSENRAPTPEELEQMKDLVRQAMEDGAIGLSTGLKYIPGAYSRTEEVIELAKVAAEYGGIYATHMREEGRGLFMAIREALTIGREAGIPVQISHFKAVGKPMWGSSLKMLALIDSARHAGLKVTFDQYPYPATSTTLGVLVPAWAFAGGRKVYLERWKDPETRKKIKEGIVDNILLDRGGGDPASVVIVESEYDSTLDGMNLREITKRFFGKVTMENVAETVLRLLEKGRHSCIFHCLSEEDVQRIMQHPAGMVASDGHTVSPDESFPHPRNYGTFPRVLGRYVRELSILTLPEAIRKMTGAVAQKLGFEHRGVLKVGNWADIVVFDPEKVIDTATWEKPKQFAEGIEHVLVNGEFVVRDGRITGKRPGKVLRRGTS
jgi:dihydroorotase/N-acyl-D-amino-acid deacylase